jgi:hypothetical protein
MPAIQYQPWVDDQLPRFFQWNVVLGGIQENLKQPFCWQCPDSANFALGRIQGCYSVRDRIANMGRER